MVEPLQGEALIAKRIAVRTQFDSVLRSSTVTCSCGYAGHVAWFYRCYYCGEYYCKTCAKEHFKVEEATLP